MHEPPEGELSYLEHKEKEARERARQISEDFDIDDIEFGEGLTQVSYDGELAPTENLLAQLLPGDVFVYQGNSRSL